MTPADLQTLKTELATDPLNRVYSTMTDEQAADSLNTQNRTPDIESVDTGVLRGCCVASEWSALAAPAKERLAFLFGSSTLAVPTHIRQELRGMFPQGSATRSNLMDATRRTGSRAEELKLGHVNPSNVADAKRLP